MTTVFDIFDGSPVSQRGPRARWAAASEAGSPLRAVVTAAWGAATVGELFYVGYQGALDQVLGGGRSKALLVTELGAKSPRHMRTTLGDGQHVRGEKAFAMLDVEEWWVMARRGEELVLARLDPQASGVETIQSDLGFLRDVPHGSVSFADAVADRIVEDAWGSVVRPFRAVEDCGVLLAVATGLLGAVRDPEHQESLLGVIGGLAYVFGSADDVAYRALFGIREQLLQLAEATELHGPLAQGWHEYRPLVGIARGARHARLEKARQGTSFDA